MCVFHVDRVWTSTRVEGGPAHVDACGQGEGVKNVIFLWTSEMDGPLVKQEVVGLQTKYYVTIILYQELYTYTVHKTEILKFKPILALVWRPGISLGYPSAPYLRLCQRLGMVSRGCPASDASGPLCSVPLWP